MVTRACVSVCLSAAVGPHYCTEQDVTLGNDMGCPLVPSYARLRGFVIGARVALLWQHITRNISEYYMLVLILCLVAIVFVSY